MEKHAGEKYSLWGSNPRPMAHKTIALATELREPSIKLLRSSLICLLVSLIASCAAFCWWASVSRSQGEAVVSDTREL